MNLLLFVIEKVISSNIKPIIVKKKLKNQTLLVEVEKKKSCEIFIANDKILQDNCQALPSQNSEHK